MDKESIRRIFDLKGSLRGLDYFEIIHEVRLMRGDEPDGLPVSDHEIALALSGDEEIEWPVQSAEEAEAEIRELYGNPDISPMAKTLAGQVVKHKWLANKTLKENSNDNSKS